MNDILAAFFLGLSFGNLWLCALLVFSLQTTNRSTCGGYLVGRAITIVGLSLAVALLGQFVTVEKSWLNIFSGLLLLGFAAYLGATRIFDWVPPWRRQATTHPDHQSCDGNCQSCPTHGHQEYAEVCQSCSDDPKLCAAEEPELEPLTRAARTSRGRQVLENEGSGFMAGLALGAMRGAALCSKLAVLIPVLLGAPIGRALGIGITFSLSSSLYPLLGFALGAFALKLVRYKQWMFATSCLMLTGFGCYYFYLGASSWHHSGLG